MTIKQRLRKFVDGLKPEDLKTLRAMINGKLSKRTLGPEDQAKMQEARKEIAARKAGLRHELLPDECGKRIDE